MNIFTFTYTIPFYPLAQLFRIQLRYGFIPLRKWKIILIWFFKFVLLEPFRLFEALIMACLPDRDVRTIFILGYYRSGTTYLQELTACNTRHGTLTIFQSVLPEVSLCFAWLFKPALSLIVAILRVQNPYHHHRFNWDYPSEEDIAITSMGCFHDYNRITQYPSRFTELTEAYLRFHNKSDETHWINAYRYVIKKLSYIYPGKTLILKSPPNMGRMAILNSTFRQSKFIFIHRDPAQSICSARRLWKLNRAFVYERCDESFIDRILTHQFGSFYELFQSQRKGIPCKEVRFDELIKRPLSVIKNIYEDLGLAGWAEVYEPLVDTIRKREQEVIPSTGTPSPEILAAKSIVMARSALGYHG